MTGTWRRRERLALAVMALACLAVVVPPPTRAADASPALRATPELLDFGTVGVHTDFEGYFRVRNVSEGVITIGTFSKEVQGGMVLGHDNGCSGPLQPGATCLLDVGGYLRDYGTFTATLRLHSDDPGSPLVMRVRATLPRPPDPPPVMALAPRPEKMLKAFLPSKRMARFRWGWAARETDNLSGFTVQWRAGARPWHTVVKPKRSNPSNAQSRKGLFAVRTGEWIHVRARPHDAAGKAAKWAARRMRVSYRDIHLGGNLRGNWKEVQARGAYGGTVVVTDRSGPTASITAKARAIAILGRKAPRQGSLRASDGGGRIPLSASKSRQLQVLYTWYWDTSEWRTVDVTAVIKSGSAKSVALDAWVVVQ